MGGRAGLAVAVEAPIAFPYIGLKAVWDQFRAFARTWRRRDALKIITAHGVERNYPYEIPPPPSYRFVITPAEIVGTIDLWLYGRTRSVRGNEKRAHPEMGVVRGPPPMAASRNFLKLASTWRPVSYPLHRGSLRLKAPMAAEYFGRNHGDASAAIKWPYSAKAIYKMRGARGRAGS